MRPWPQALLLCVGFMGCRAFVLPPPTLPKGAEQDAWPDTGAVVVEDVATLEFRVMPLPILRGARLMAVLDHRRRIKILQDSGLNAADVVLPMDGYSTVTRVVARSLSPTLQQVDMLPEDLHTSSSGHPDQQAPDLSTLQFHIPNAVVGGQIEYRYERVYVDPYLVPPWVFADALPVMRSEFGLLVNDKVKVDYRYGHGEQLVDRPPIRQDDDRLIFIEEDVAALYREPFGPHPTRLAPWIAVTPRIDRSDGAPKRFETWDDVAQQVYGRLLQVQGTPGEGTAVDRYHLLQQQVVPLAQPGLGVRMPQPSQALMAGTPACSRDAAALLSQSLLGTDVPVAVALLNGPTAPPLWLEFPALYPFSAALVAVDLKESQTYLDPMCGTCAFGVLPAAKALGRALLVSPRSGRWVQMPPVSPLQNSLTSHGKMTLNLDGTVTGDIEAQLRGTQAGQARRSIAAANGAGNDVETARHIVVAHGPNVLAASWGNPNFVDLPLEARLTVKSPGERLDETSFRIRGAALVGATVPAAWRGTRHSLAILDGPRWWESSVDVVLPAGFAAEVGQGIKLANRFFEYAAAYTRGAGANVGRGLHFTRRFVLKTATVDAADWDEFVLQAAKITDFEQQGPRVGSLE